MNEGTSYQGGTQPREVRTAFAVGIASIVVAPVVGVLSLVVADPLADARQRMYEASTSGRSGSGMSQHQVDTLVDVMVVLGAVIGAAMLAVQVFLLVKMRAGRGWARIVLTVFFGVGLAGTAISAVSQLLVGGAPLTVVTSVPTLLLWAATVWLMHRPEANAYFAPPTLARPAVAWQPPPPIPVVQPSSYVPWHTRALSGLVDHGLPTAVFLVFYVPFGNGDLGMGGDRGLVIMLAVIAVLVAVQVWNSAFVQGRTGQSWGRRVARTRLIDERTGRPLGAGRAFLRLLAHFLDSAACYVGWLFPLWDRPKRQTFADKMAHSIVVHAPRPS